MATKYKGRYVGKVILDIELDPSKGARPPFEQAKECIMKELTLALQNIIGYNLCGDDATCEVIQEYADLWEVEE